MLGKLKCHPLLTCQHMLKICLVCGFLLIPLHQYGVYIIRPGIYFQNTYRYRHIFCFLGNVALVHLVYCILNKAQFATMVLTCAPELHNGLCWKICMLYVWAPLLCSYNQIMRFMLCAIELIFFLRLENRKSTRSIKKNLRKLSYKLNNYAIWSRYINKVAWNGK